MALSIIVTGQSYFLKCTHIRTLKTHKKAYNFSVITMITSINRVCIDTGAARCCTYIYTPHSKIFDNLGIYSGF